MVAKIFVSIGVIATSFIVGIALFVIIEEFIEIVVNNRKYKKKLKNRFDGGPTAKCFCKDCRYYSEINKQSKHNHGAGECRAHQGLVVSDCWYCWRASPVEHSEAKKTRKN